MNTNIIVIIGISLALFIYMIAIYNTLITLKNRYANAFSQIEVQLKRRYDLIPNIIEVAKGYLNHERETLEAVTVARNEAMALLKTAAENPGGDQMQKFVSAESVLQQALGKLNVVMEAYPDIKASHNMMQLSEELTSTENKVAFARQGFNDSVMAYNIYRESFPQIVFAKIMGHTTSAKLLEFDDSPQIQQAPKVSF